MSASIHKDMLVVVADGEHAKLFTNISATEISLQSKGNMSLEYLDDKGPSTLPPESSEKETQEATNAKHITTDLYNRAHKNEYSHLVLVADPQTLGQIRQNLHSEVEDKIVLELPKTLANTPIEDIEKSISSAIK